MITQTQYQNIVYASENHKLGLKCREKYRDNDERCCLCVMADLAEDVLERPRGSLEIPEEVGLPMYEEMHKFYGMDGLTFRSGFNPKIKILGKYGTMADHNDSNIFDFSEEVIGYISEKTHEEIGLALLDWANEQEIE